jgi:hypothetical protein
MAGAPVFSIIDTSDPGSMPAKDPISPMLRSASPSLEVDAFPNHLFKGTVGSLSRHRRSVRDPLYRRNYVRQFRQVVQRVPVRIYFDRTTSSSQAESRHERLRHDRHQPSPLAPAVLQRRRRWRTRTTLTP